MDSPPDVYEFELTDRHGEVHEYTMAYHPGDEGLDIVLDLGALLAGPLASMLGLAFGSGKLSLDSELSAEAMAAIDWSALGNDLQRHLAAPSSRGLIMRILKHTARDGAPLGKARNFGRAYAGNYAELFDALWAVVEGNGFLPLDAISKLVPAKPEAAAKE